MQARTEEKPDRTETRTCLLYTSWYVKYLDYLIGNEYIELPEALDGENMEDFAAGALTYGEAAFAAEKVEKGLSKALNISRKKYDAVSYTHLRMREPDALPYGRHLSRPAGAFCK